jgi:AraC-like DNA-binding protein
MERTSIDLYGHTFAECISIEGSIRGTRYKRDDACLSYVETGKQEIYSASQRVVAANKESILMKCDNYVTSFGNEVSNAKSKAVVFHLDLESIKKAFGDKDLDFLKVDRTDAPIDPALKIDRSELLDSFVASMQPYFDKPQIANDNLLAVKLQELVYILTDSGNNPLATQIIGTLHSPEEIAFDEIISANLYNNLSLSEMAHLTARSESSFKREFSKWYKDSPAKYLKTKRLEKAAELLKSSSLQIREIAWETGFENAAHFSTSFVKHFGHSPKEFRT